jgi:hypothetical protein
MENTTLQTTVISGLLGLCGVLGGALISARSQNDLAKIKYDSDLVLKALMQPKAKDRLEFLKFLIATNLLKDENVKKGVSGYCDGKEESSYIPYIDPNSIS